jgi:hypothetical protein
MRHFEHLDNPGFKHLFACQDRRDAIIQTGTAPASFTSHQGNFSSEGVILVAIMRSHSADSCLVLGVAEEPKPVQVRVLLEFGGSTGLLHLAWRCCTTLSA